MSPPFLLIGWPAGRVFAIAFRSMCGRLWLFLDYFVGSIIFFCVVWCGCRFLHFLFDFTWCGVTSLLSLLTFRWCIDFLSIDFLFFISFWWWPLMPDDRYFQLIDDADWFSMPWLSSICGLLLLSFLFFLQFFSPEDFRRMPMMSFDADAEWLFSHGDLIFDWCRHVAFSITFHYFLDWCGFLLLHFRCRLMADATLIAVADVLLSISSLSPPLWLFLRCRLLYRLFSIRLMCVVSFFSFISGAAFSLSPAFISSGLSLSLDYFSMILIIAADFCTKRDYRFRWLSM